MRLLLDTHVLLWALADPARIDAAATALIRDRANQVLFSAASIWEIAIKATLRRADFDADPALVLQGARLTGFEELPVRAEATLLLRDLPAHHRDPFDRLLIAQALCEPLRLFTADAMLRRYSELVTVVGG